MRITFTTLYPLVLSGLLLKTSKGLCAQRNPFERILLFTSSWQDGNIFVYASSFPETSKTIECSVQSRG
jgi:hypothetical protein